MKKTTPLLCAVVVILAGSLWVRPAAQAQGAQPQDVRALLQAVSKNIGDMGGVSLALDAYHASLRDRPAPVIEGLTGDQRVFLGWAQVWREKIRDETLRQRLVSDSHSPARYRVNGVIRNVDAWYSAFQVRPGDALYVAPADRVRIW